MKRLILAISAIAVLYFSACSGSGTTVVPATSSRFAAAYPGIDTVKFYLAPGGPGTYTLNTSNPPIRISATGVLNIPYLIDPFDTFPAATFNIVIDDTVVYAVGHYIDIRRPGVDTLIINGTLGKVTSPTGQTYCQLNFGGGEKYMIPRGYYYGKW